MSRLRHTALLVAVLLAACAADGNDRGRVARSFDAAGVIDDRLAALSRMVTESVA